MFLTKKPKKSLKMPTTQPVSNHDPVATNLRRLMKQQDISEAELSRQTHVPQPTIHKILTGKTADPRASTLVALADFFKISVDELILGVETKRQNMITHSIPIISWSESVDSENFIQTLNTSNWAKWIITEAVAENSFALLSKPSMEPRFPPGTALIIKPNSKPDDGDIVLAHYANTNETTLREISIDGPHTFLARLYGDTAPQPIPADISFKGTLIRSIFSFPTHAK